MTALGLPWFQDDLQTNIFPYRRCAAFWRWSTNKHFPKFSLCCYSEMIYKQILSPIPAVVLFREDPQTNIFLFALSSADYLKYLQTIFFLTSFNAAISGDSYAFELPMNWPGLLFNIVKVSPVKVIYLWKFNFCLKIFSLASPLFVTDPPQQLTPINYYTAVI